MTTTKDFDWTEERVAELKQRWHDGESAGEIARAMGLPTRNAVVGKAHRLGLKNADHIVRVARSRVPSGGRPRHSPRPRPTVAQATESRATPGDDAALPVIPIQLVDGDPLTTADAVFALGPLSCDGGATTCRWPTGTPGHPGFKFCMEPTSVPPYCGHHARISYAPTPGMARARFRY